MLINEYINDFEAKRNRYEKEIEKINSLRGQARCLKSKPFDKDYITGGERGGFSDKIDAYIDMQQDTLNDFKQEYEKSLNELINLIYKLPDIKHCHLLHHIYINKRTMKEASERMGMSYNYAYEVKRKALYKLNDILTLNE